MHAQAVGNRARARSRWTVVVAVVVIGLTGCTTDSTSSAHQSGTARSASVAPGGAGPLDVDPQAACRPAAISGPPDLLALRDVWGSDNGGTAATVVNLSQCARSTFSATNVVFVCRLPFPWLSAADAAGQLAALGAEQVRVSRLVGPQGRTVTETVVRFAAGARPGAAELIRQAVDCGGTLAGSGPEATTWSRHGGTTLAVRSARTWAVAVEYVDAGLSRRQQEVLMERAVAKAAAHVPG